MSSYDIVMPKMGESITSGTITKWHKNPGDQVELDDILFEISTDKVESEIPSPFAGFLWEILHPEGATVEVGKTVAVIGDTPVAQATKTSVAEETKSKVRKFFTPLVRAMATANKIPLAELEQIVGSGVAGRVTKQDLEKYLQGKGKGKGSIAAKPVPPETPVRTVIATPVASIVASPLATPIGQMGKVEVIPMDNMRKSIAKNMVLSKTTIPHVNSISEVDLTHLVKFRTAFKDEFFGREGFKLTYTPFIIKALAMALQAYPYVNATVDGDNIVLKKEINIGCAVAVPGNGLVVPVIKNADTLNMVGLCRAINSLAEKARGKKLSMEDLSGGTFTFTNVGSFNTLLATPVILPPQVGIYAAGVITRRVVVMDDDALAIRSMMYGTHTYDHRIVDGELGGKFLEAVHQNLVQMRPQELF